MKHKIHPKTGALLLVAALSATQVVAGPLEDRFKEFLDGLRARGQAVLPGRSGVPEVTAATLTQRTDALPLGQDQAVVFVADGCRTCSQIAERLKGRLGVVEVMNLSTSQTAREAFAATGAKGVPALLIGKRLVTGYSDALIERAIIDETLDRSRSMGGQGA